jgi:tRNA(Leu) C34 or U34 (ribose-2'-O)-methylase TrmL
MVFHVVLFRPRTDLETGARADLVEALETALQRIPSIRRFNVGRRIRHDAGYEALMPIDLEYGAVIEFDDLAGLQEYLHHPAHQALGRQFMSSLESSAIYDYQMQDGEHLRRHGPLSRLPIDDRA